MSGNRVICFNDKILFRTSLCVVNAIGIQLPIESFMTKFGLVIPLDKGGLTPFAINGFMFDNRFENTELLSMYKFDMIDNYEALLIDRFGKCYYMGHFTYEPLQFYLNFIPHGRGIKFTLSSNGVNDDINNTALMCNDNINKVFEVITNTVAVMSADHYKIFNINELTSWVVKCFEHNELLPYEGLIESPIDDQNLDVSPLQIVKK